MNPEAGSHPADTERESPVSNFYATRPGGDEFKTKKALREYIAQRPDEVHLEDTSAFNNRGVLRGIDNLTDMDVIVGPNPWRARNWYASIRNGRVV